MAGSAAPPGEGAGAGTLLTLQLVAPKGGPSGNLEVDSELTGTDLRTHVHTALGIQPDAQLLYFQNPIRNSAKVSVDDDRSLRSQGIEDGATLLVRLSTVEVAPSDSVLRQSIAKNGNQSYYYAHASEKQLPHEHRYVYGGAPVKLSDAEIAAVAPPEAASEDAAPPVTAIKNYSWADGVDFVSIYISADGEPDAVAAAGDGKGGEVETQFDARLAELKVKGPNRTFALVLRDLEGEVEPQECKHRVSEGKRLTIKLRKKRKGTWTRLVKKS